ncbi:hypothetical protein V6N13_013938 [Hibiscus sabdariffa]
MHHFPPTIYNVFQVCVKITADSVIPKHVGVKLSDGSLAHIKVVVPWIPPYCPKCCSFGHSDKSYPKLEQKNEKVSRVNDNTDRVMGEEYVIVVIETTGDPFLCPSEDPAVLLVRSNDEEFPSKKNLRMALGSLD